MNKATMVSELREVLGSHPASPIGILTAIDYVNAGFVDAAREVITAIANSSETSPEIAAALRRIATAS